MKRSCNGCKASTYFGGTLICELSFDHTVFRDSKGAFCGIPQCECPKPYTYVGMYEYALEHGIRLAARRVDNLAITAET